MNTLELNDALFCLPHFVGTFPCDEIPFVASRPCSYVINLDEAKKNGSHWTAIYVDLFNNATYFDSFGILPFNEKVIQFLNYVSPNQWIFNDVKMQDKRSDVCGYYCTFFILLIGKGVALREFQKLFTDDFKFNDILVKEYVHNYIEQHKKSH